MLVIFPTLVTIQADMLHEFPLDLLVEHLTRIRAARVQTQQKSAFKKLLVIFYLYIQPAQIVF